MRTFTLLLTFILLGVACGCKKNRNNYFPSVAFQQRIYLNNPSSVDLSAPGGWIYAEGGYKGLIIYRRYINGGQDDFAAYDRGCPTHFSEACGLLKISTDEIFMTCDCDDAQYLLFDGSPGKGASLGMKAYPVIRNGDVLFISN